MSIRNMDIVAEKNILLFARDAMILSDTMILRLKKIKLRRCREIT
jgi:hypothetical protein